MMFQPRRLKMLKRRYEQLLRISLQVRGGPGLCSTPSAENLVLGLWKTAHC
jgi:hypothetical protein